MVNLPSEAAQGLANYLMQVDYIKYKFNGDFYIIDVEETRYSLSYFIQEYWDSLV